MTSFNQIDQLQKHSQRIDAIDQALRDAVKEFGPLRGKHSALFDNMLDAIITACCATSAHRYEVGTAMERSSNAATLELKKELFEKLGYTPDEGKEDSK